MKIAIRAFICGSIFGLVAAHFISTILWLIVLGIVILIAGYEVYSVMMSRNGGKNVETR